MLVLLTLAHAASVAAQLTSPEITEGQTVDLYVQVTDAAIPRPPDIRSPDGLRVQFDSRSVTKEMYNFKTREITTFLYRVTGLKPGDYTLGPLSLKSGPETLLAPALKLKVGERDAAGGVDTLVADLSATELWLGQTVVLHMKMSTPRQVVSARWGPPENPLLTAEPGIEPVLAEYRVGEGSRPLTVEETWYPMRAQAVGRSTLNGGSLLAQYAVRRKRGRSDFFNDLPVFADIENDTLVANAIPVVVKALPTEGRPENFSGLVGSFSFEATPSATQTRVGDTVTVDVTLKGNGRVAGYTLPEWSGASFRVYDDTPASSSRLLGGEVETIAAFKRAVVPAAAGALELPPLEANWFDPAEGRYVVARLDPIRLDVVGTSAAAAIEPFGPVGTAERPAVPAEAEDILPVRTQVGLAAPISGLWAWLSVLPGAVWLGVQLAPRLRRPHKAQTASTYGFADLPNDAEGRLAGLERIFREEAARRLGLAEPEVKREHVATLGEEAAQLYREFETARYRGSAELPEARLRAWLGAQK